MNDAPADKQSQFYCVNTYRKPFRAQAPLPIPKLYGSYSGHSYILSSLREERLGEKGGAFFNGKEGRDDFRNSYVRTKTRNMNIIKTNIDGVLIIEPRLFRDARGYFFESFSEREFDEKVTPILGHKVHFCQDNESMSSYGVMRGLHFQRPPFTQSKLVRCVKGRVLDVAVDIRKGSPTYGKHVAVELTEDNHRQFFIPKGFAHGFAVLSETAVFQYKCDEFYHPEADGGISILDDSLGIDWKIPTEHANLSEKDTKHDMLKDFDSPFHVNIDLYEN